MRDRERVKETGRKAAKVQQLPVEREDRQEIVLEDFSFFPFFLFQLRTFFLSFEPERGKVSLSLSLSLGFLPFKDPLTYFIPPTRKETASTFFESILSAAAAAASSSA